MGEALHSRAKACRANHSGSTPLWSVFFMRLDGLSLMAHHCGRNAHPPKKRMIPFPCNSTKERFQPLPCVVRRNFVPQYVRKEHLPPKRTGPKLRRSSDSRAATVVGDKAFRLSSHTCESCTPYSKYHLFSGYHVDPLLKKEVFTMENRSVFPKNTLKTAGLLSRGHVSNLVRL